MKSPPVGAVGKAEHGPTQTRAQRLFDDADPLTAKCLLGSGTVYIILPSAGRVIENTFNTMGESEYLIPHYISPSEIVGNVPK